MVGPPTPVHLGLNSVEQGPGPGRVTPTSGGGRRAGRGVPVPPQVSGCKRGVGARNDFEWDGNLEVFLRFLEMGKCSEPIQRGSFGGRRHPLVAWDAHRTLAERGRRCPDVKSARPSAGSRAPGTRAAPPEKRRAAGAVLRALAAASAARHAAPGRGWGVGCRNSRRSPNSVTELGTRSCRRRAAAKEAARPLGVGRGWEGDR